MPRVVMLATASVLGPLERRGSLAAVAPVDGIDEGPAWSRVPRSCGSHDAWPAAAPGAPVARGVARLECAFASGFGDVYDAAGRRLANVSHKQRSRRRSWWKETSRRRRRFLTLPERIDEPLLVLTASTSALYFHWLLDVLPRYLVARSAGVADGRLVYAAAGASFQRETLAALGLDGRLVDADRSLLVHARDVAVPAHELASGHLVPEWTLRFLREELGPRLGASRSRFGPRLYVSRRDARRDVRNEEELLAALAPLGFECVYPSELSVAEQVAAFAGAEVVVGPHGSAMANLVFCAPGTLLVELFSNSYLEDTSYRVSQSAGLDYRFLREPRGVHFGRPIERHFDIVPEELLATLAEAAGIR